MRWERRPAVLHGQWFVLPGDCSTPQVGFITPTPQECFGTAEVRGGVCSGHCCDSLSVSTGLFDAAPALCPSKMQMRTYLLPCNWGYLATQLLIWKV